MDLSGGAYAGRSSTLMQGLITHQPHGLPMIYQGVHLQASLLTFSDILSLAGDYGRVCNAGFSAP